MISVVTVTYGNRWQYLQQMISPLLGEKNISRIVIVDNGSNYDLRLELDNLHSSKIHLIQLANNTGSANGFKSGIDFVQEKNETAFVYLLDDDNVIQENTINALIYFWDSSGAKNKNVQVALLSLRNDRKYLVNAARGESLLTLFPNGNLFLGFDLLRLPRILLLKIKSKYFRNRKNEMKARKIPMAPYGGLFFHRDIISVIGLPDDRFFVYTDDFEFTYRITKTHGEIWLIPESEIQDVSINQLYRSKHSLFRSRYLEAKGNIAYFSVRNPTFFSSRKLVTSQTIFRINIAVYTCYLFLLAIFTGKLKRFKIYLKAVSDGLKGNFEIKQINNGE